MCQACVCEVVADQPMPTFESLVPAFIQKCAELNTLLRLVAFMLFIVGIILFAAHGVSGKKLMGTLGHRCWHGYGGDSQHAFHGRRSDQCGGIIIAGSGLPFRRTGGRGQADFTGDQGGRDLIA